MDFKLTERQKQILLSLNITNEIEMINYFPFRYNDYSLTKIDQNCDKKKVVVRGTVREIGKTIYLNKSLKKFVFRIMDNKESYLVIVYNREYITSKLKIGSEVLLTGKLNYKKHEITLNEIFFENLDLIKITPVYHLNDSIKDKEFNFLMKMAFKNIDESYFKENIPLEFINKYHLISKKQAYYYAHFPSNKEQLKKSFLYLKYKELLSYSTKVLLTRGRMRKKKDIPRLVDKNNLNLILKENNIKLTFDQIKVVKEIINDINSQYNMFRMLIGDVGSGKTLVATLAMAAVVENSYQAVLLCPTDILARQHYEFMTNFLKKYRICLLVSNLKNKDNIKENIKNHAYDIIIGTTALLEDDVIFYNLGMVVIDEQHRFGVKQREKIIAKGKNVDVLYMSATPIPRSLALSLYGEMDVSIIRQFPNKIRDVKSYVIKSKDIKPLLVKIDRFLQKRMKIFIVCPLIEKDENKNDAESIYLDLKKMYPNEVSLVHGKLKDEDKNKIIEDFKNDKFHILVTTTVIEVGIDIKDASVMIIFDANCFGLATLHQLRGRVGRNGQKAYCYFLCRDKKDMNRLNFLKENNDGFKIAEYDLHSRGEGELIGIKQSGDSSFKFTNIEKDLNILLLSRKDALKILNNYENSFEYRNYVTKL